MAVFRGGGDSMSPLASPSVPLRLVSLILLVLPAINGFYLQGTDMSYARFPKWNACINASVSFEFKTSQREGLLLYVDDGGRYDFFEIMHINGRVRTVLNIVNGRDGHINLDAGNNINDGQWHTVMLKRNRMETSLLVDGVPARKPSFGSDFHFGAPMNNSYLYLGGLPAELIRNLHDLALPSVLFQQRFKGSMRNVLYSNCSCQTVRVKMIDAVGVNQNPPENCDVRNPCREGCICISTDTEPRCDCSELQCVTVQLRHYILPMDLLLDTTLINPSGLDSSAFGSPNLVRGLVHRAIRLDGKNTYVRVVGPGHRSECFGDLDLCPSGYTLSMWLNFEDPCDEESVYMSNGGHSKDNHGVAMLFRRGKLEYRFRKKNGQEWRATHDNVLPGRWYHVTVTWKQEDGLSLYIDGELVNTTPQPTVRSPGAVRDQYNEFFLGRANDENKRQKECIFIVDEFNFWSTLKTPSEIRENGPFYCYHLSMDDTIQGTKMTGTKLPSVKTYGNPRVVAGKIGQAMSFDGRTEYIDGGDQSETCLGDIELCQYGLTVSLWIQFSKTDSNTYIISTGNNGFQMYLDDNEVVVLVQKEEKFWEGRWPAPHPGSWHFMELTWNEAKGLQVYQDLKLVAQQGFFDLRMNEESADTKLYVGRSNSDMQNGEKFLSALIDELQMCYGDRETLVAFDFIQRGEPGKYLLGMDYAAGNRLQHSSLDIDLKGGANLTPAGKIGPALYLNGNGQYANLGAHAKSCFGNLNLCRHGIHWATWFDPGQMSNNMELLSTGKNGMRIWYAGGQLHFSFKTTTREWTLSTANFDPNNWQFLETSWSEKNGISVFVNNQLVASSNKVTMRSDADLDRQNAESANFYVGRGNGLSASSKSANMTVDEMEYWYGNRAFLLAFDYIQRGLPFHYLFNMDTVRGGKLMHTSMDIAAKNGIVNVPGKVDNAIRLNGDQSQYLDLGQHQGSCFGDLEKCRHGLTGAFWANFRTFENNMYYFSNGNGVKVYNRNGRMYFVLQTGGNGREWEVAIPDLKLNQWYFLEYSWSAERGLKVYINNRLVGYQSTPRYIPNKDFDTSAHIYFGRANNGDTSQGNFHFANALIDEGETWFRDRDTLLAFGYILRDNVTHLHIPFEDRRGNFVSHPSLTIPLHNDANLKPGKIGNALSLDGSGQYVDLGSHPTECMGNLERCLHGLTISFYVHPNRLVNDGYFLSSGAYSLYQKDGRTHAKFQLPDKTWTLSTDKLEAGKWQRVDLSWDMDKGLKMLIDDTVVASTPDFYPELNGQPEDYTIYIGRPSSSDSGGRYGDANVDEMEYWYADIDHLKAFGLIGGGVKHLVMDMEAINGDILVHPSQVIYTHGGPSITNGYYGNGVWLNGANQQYLDAGTKPMCGGDLNNCPRGYTMRFRMQPNELKDNTYFVSSAMNDVYYKDGYLWAVFRSPDGRQWQVKSNQIKAGAGGAGNWYVVDVSWDPQNGATMYVNNVAQDQMRLPMAPDQLYDADRRFFIGRANTNMRREQYPNAVIDDVQLWEARRDYLLGMGLIRWPEEGGGPVTPRPSPRPDDDLSNIPKIGPKQMLVFDGKSWITYDFSKLPEEYLQKNDYEKFHIRFKTEQPEGLLWYSGNENRNMHLSLKNGLPVLLVDYGTGPSQRFRVQPPGGLLNDNEWHDVIIVRDGRQVIITVDETEFPQTLSGTADVVNPGQVYLGGSGNTNTLTNGQTQNNFIGYVKEAVMSGNTLPNDLDLLGLYLREPELSIIDITGQIDVEDMIGPSKPQASSVKFTQPSAFLRMPLWQFQKHGELNMTFRTQEPHGLMLYNGAKPGNRDFVAVEMYNGIVYLVLDLGDGVHRYPFSFEPLNDGQPHKLTIWRYNRNLRLSLDNKTVEYNIPSKETTLDLGTFLFLGGVDNPDRLPWHIWSRTREHGFIGCIWDFKINVVEVDLAEYLRNQIMNGIEVGCADFLEECPARPCLHGECKELVTGYECDCADTDFTGKNCDIDAKIVTFDGTDFVKINLTPMMSSHTNDISLRFKTLKRDGLLFTTSNEETADYLTVSLDNGRGKLSTNLGQNIGQKKVMYFCENLNDNEWHTLHIRRRADYLEAWADDDCEHAIGDIPNEGYTLDIDAIRVAALDAGDKSESSFVGYMQNFILNGYKFFELLGPDQLPGVDIENTGKVGHVETLIPFYPVTFRSRTNSFSSVTAFPITGSSSLEFMFKTQSPDGLLFYNEGRESDYFAVELLDGRIYMSLDDGSGPKVVSARSNGGRLDDNVWHNITIKQLSAHEFQVTVDGVVSTVATRLTPNRLELTDKLYVGGVPDNMYATLPRLVASKTSFSGCMATVKINGVLFDLLGDAINKNAFVSAGCTNATSFCLVDSCEHRGYCMEALNSFLCDCNMTSFVGGICTQEAEGFRYGKNDRDGIVIYNFPLPQDTDTDRLAFGFMTWAENGTLVRVDSGISADYIEAKLENGHVVLRYDVGDGRQEVIEDRRLFHDGAYHYVTFVRKGSNATMTVDDYPARAMGPKGSMGSIQRLFNEQAVIKLGGNRDYQGNLMDHFKGILAGVYFNGQRFIDMRVYDRNQEVKVTGDVLTAMHPFYLPRPSITQPTRKPPIDVPAVIDPPDGNEIPVDPKPKPPLVDVPNVVPAGPQGGGGVAWQPVGPNGEGIAVVVDPGGGGAGMGGGAGVPNQPGVAAAAVGGGAGAGGGAEGARAGAVAGTFLGILVAASGIMWAAYKLKPGIVGAAGGAPAGPMNISSPRASTNYSLVKSHTGSLGTGYRGGGGAAAGGGSGTAMTAILVEANGSAAGGGGGRGRASAGTQTPQMMAASMFSDYPAIAASGQYATMGAVSGLMAGDGIVTRAVQTDLAYIVGASESAYASASGTMMSAASGSGAGGGYGAAGYSQNVRNIHSETHVHNYSSYNQAAAGGASSAASVKSVASIETQTMPEPTAATPLLQQEEAIVPARSPNQRGGYSEDQLDTINNMSAAYNYSESQSYNSMNESLQHQSSSRSARTLSPDPYAADAASGGYSMQAMVQNGSSYNGAANNLWAGGEQHSSGVMLASEEIRVDCVHLTADGRNVVTGSIFGPPQVWDLRTGDLVRIMSGEELSSTDLHLACNDSLLVGQVAEITQVDPNDNLATSRVNHRKLQIWDFESANPLEMATSELCTASCVMADGERVALGRTEKFGNGTTIVIYDLLGNEAVRTLKYDGAIGFADYISFLTLSKDNRYVIAGFQNSYDGNANFIIFDLTKEARYADGTGSPLIVALDAQAECTAVLDNHEAVTGTHKGELTIWSMRTGKATRKLVSPPPHPHSRGYVAQGMNAHSKEVKTVVVSADGKYLVSASADATLKVWDLETERLMYTLTGHTDEVWCCCISADSDLLVSGSRDQTIRLWRLATGQQISSFNTGVDVFTVKISNDKKTIVALGDKFHTRKLIMLQVVVKKVRSRAGSRATSPLAHQGSPPPQQHHQQHQQQQQHQAVVAAMANDYTSGGGGGSQQQQQQLQSHSTNKAGSSHVSTVVHNTQHTSYSSSSSAYHDNGYAINY